MKLLRADFGASYLWRTDLGSFQHGFGFNMNPLNPNSYDDWYQFRDPMTAKLRQRRRASFVEEVLPRRDMLRTEFYNDFLARDGLDHGINMFVFDGDRDLVRLPDLAGCRTPGIRPADGFRRRPRMGAAQS